MNRIGKSLDSDYYVILYNICLGEKFGETGVRDMQMCGNVKKWWLLCS